jgi:hypothetical protein
MGLLIRVANREEHGIRKNISELCSNLFNGTTCATHYILKRVFTISPLPPGERSAFSHDRRLLNSF